MLRRARDPDLRRRLGEAGRMRVSREFSVERCVGSHSELYDELLSRAASVA